MGFGKFLKGIFGDSVSGFLGGPGGIATGALAGGISSALSHKPQMKTISNLTPQQQQWQSLLGNQSAQALQNPYEGFQPIENQAREQFHTSTIPLIAERFTSMGNGGQRSSAFGSATDQAAVGLESNLAAMRSQYGLQNRQLAGGQLAQALQPSFQNYQQEQTPGFLESSLGSLAGGLGQYGTLGSLGMLGNNQNQAPGSFGGLPPQLIKVLQSPAFMQWLKTQGVQ